MENYQKSNFVNNEWLTEGDGSFLSVLDKYDGQEIARIPQASEAQMETAIVAASKAFEETKNWSAGKHAQMMQALYDQLEEQKEKFRENYSPIKAETLSFYDFSLCFLS